MGDYRKEDDGLDQSGHALVFILKMEPIGFPERTGVGCEKEKGVQDSPKAFGLSHRKAGLAISRGREDHGWTGSLLDTVNLRCLLSAKQRCQITVGYVNLQLSGEVRAGDRSWGVSSTSMGFKATSLTDSTKDGVCLEERFGI